MEKKYIIGLSQLKYFGTLEDLDNICKKYSNIINTWYISPPFGEEYCSRLDMLTIPTEKNLLEIYDQIDIIKKNNQNIQLALNGFGLKNIDIKLIQQHFDFWIKMFGKPDSIVLLDELVPYFLNYSIPLTLSYNSTTFKNLKYCNVIVLGNRHIRNIKLMENLKNKYNIKIELLVNNGCHFLCKRECNKCEELQQKRIQQIGFNRALAEQTLLPEELNYYPQNLIDYIKISSRPINKDILDKTLYFYSNKFSNTLDLNQINNWRYFGRLKALIEAGQNIKIDSQEIINIKKEIWKNITFTLDY